MHALYGFIGGRIFWSMSDKIKCIYLFRANYRMLIHGHFFVGFFLILFWACQNCTFSISIWYIFTYLTLNWMKVVWKHIFENRIYKIFPYILWIKFWCFWFKHSTMSLSYCLCWLRQYTSLQSKGFHQSVVAWSSGWNLVSYPYVWWFWLHLLLCKYSPTNTQAPNVWIRCPHIRIKINLQSNTKTWKSK